jgi:hypothetical protein
MRPRTDAATPHVIVSEVSAVSTAETKSNRSPSIANRMPIQITKI